MTTYFPHQGDDPATSVASVGISIQGVVGIPELGHMIIGFLATQDSLRSVSLTSRCFYSAARPYIWRTFKMPYINLSAELEHRHHISSHPFWESSAYELERYTRSVCVNMNVTAPNLLSNALWRQWSFLAHTNHEGGLDLKSQMNLLFHHLKETLVNVPWLRAFSCQDVPRVLDLIILLRRQCPFIESIDIKACIQDTIGLHRFPRHDIHRWNSWRREMGEVQLPLANLVNLVNLHVNPPIESVFDFPNLRILSLTNLQFDGRIDSEYLTQLVSILKASPNLTYLELSASRRMGGLTITGYFTTENVYPHSVGMLEELCRQYRSAGGKPLHLKVLRISRGFNRLGRTRPRRFLGALINYDCLEELHLDDKSEDNDWDGSELFGLVRPKSMPKLRKLIWPWVQFDLMHRFQATDPDFLARIILRIPKPHQLGSGRPTLWVTFGYYTLLRQAESDRDSGRGVKLRGLVLPSQYMAQKETERFLASASWFKSLESLKIRLSRLALSGGDGESEKRFQRFAEMEELRNLLLLDGKFAKMMKRENADDDEETTLPDPCFNDAQLKVLAGKFATICPKLSYLRILNRAWHIVRREEENGSPELRPLTAWEVKNKLPYAFDYRTPRVA